MAYVEHPDAYDAAVRQRIMANSRKGKGSHWLSDDPTRSDVINFLERKSASSAFYRDIYGHYIDYWVLSEKQESCVRDGMKKELEYREKAFLKDKNSAHVGNIGERIDFSLVFRNRISYETAYGTMYVNFFEDSCGNLLVYKGKKIDCEKGDNIFLKATIKTHEVRNEINQTIISRPKILDADL